MRLTVGPLPAAVYWRRRAVVLVGLAAVVLVLSYSCGGPDASNAGPTGVTVTTDQPTTTPPPHPTDVAPTTTPPATAFSLVTTAPSGGCGDTEIELTASAPANSVKQGQPVELTLKVKNISDRTCSRDVGADMQELKLQDQSGLVWSSDDCNPRHGTNVVSFGAGKESSFSLSWTGRISRSGTGEANCSPSAQLVTPGVYDLVARLDKKVSAPFQLKVTT